jgi:hypothetical protein
MSSNNNSLQEKKLYLKQMSQHFKEMAGKQDDETRKVIANTFSKNADILEDILSIRGIIFRFRRGEKSNPTIK